jgi:hypothetical protein
MSRIEKIKEMEDYLFNAFEDWSYFAKEKMGMDIIINIYRRTKGVKITLRKRGFINDFETNLSFEHDFYTNDVSFKQDYMLAINFGQKINDIINDNPQGEYRIFHSENLSNVCRNDFKAIKEWVNLKWKVFQNNMKHDEIVSLP